MRVLVTGHTGFVGAQCAKALIATGLEVVGLSRRRSNLKGLVAQFPADLGGSEGLVGLDDDLGSCDAIVHCAANTSRDDGAAEIIQTNCLGTQRMIDLAQRLSITHFVFLSGVPVIGVPEETPIDESHRARPRSTYHASKLFGEHLVAAATERGLAGICLRLTAPVGPTMPSSRMLRVFIDRAVRSEALTVLGQGSRRQNYVHVDDVAAAVVLTLDTEAAGILNIGGPSSISNLELAQLCIARAGSHSEIVNGGTDPEEGTDWEVSSAAAEQALNYRPKWAITDTIDQLVAAGRS